MWKLSSFVTCFVLHLWNVVWAQGIPSSSASLIFNRENAVVDPGMPLTLDCGVEGPYRSCIWEKSGEKPLTFQVLDIHEGRMQGLSKPTNTKGNECGITINRVDYQDHGEWTCKVFVVGRALSGSKNVIVTVKPQPPLLDIEESPLVVLENEEKEIMCTVTAARPAAGIRWFIGTEDVTARSTSESFPTDEKGTYRSVSKLNYKFHHTEDRKGLRCSITHATLQEPEFSEVPLDIRFVPYPISSTKIYGIPLVGEYEIKYNFTANPVPADMVWKVRDIEVDVPGENDRYVASIRNLIDNIYMATLKIRDFNEEDLGLTYRLMARNSIGERNFDVTLSTGPAPPDGTNGVASDGALNSNNQFDSEDAIGGGALAAIVVIIIFIFILLFIIGVMRYRQMYCFGPKDKIKDHLKESGENLKEEHDTESAAKEPKAGKTKTTTNFFKNVTALIRPKKSQKEPRLDKIEEGEGKEENKDSKEAIDDSVRRTGAEE